MFQFESNTGFYSLFGVFSVSELIVKFGTLKSLIFLSENAKLAQSSAIGDLIRAEISSLDPVDWLHAVEITITFIRSKKRLFPVLEDVILDIYRSENLTNLVKCKAKVDFFVIDQDFNVSTVTTRLPIRYSGHSK